jgi:hypothetical protein
MPDSRGLTKPYFHLGRGLKIRSFVVWPPASGTHNHEPNDLKFQNERFLSILEQNGASPPNKKKSKAAAATCVPKIVRQLTSASLITYRVYIMYNSREMATAARKFKTKVATIILLQQQY